MTAVSDVAIGKIALSKIGESTPITSFDDENKPARELKKRYEFVRDAELRRRKWCFSLTRTTLPAIASPDPAPTPYSYAYQLPSDCLKVLSVGDYAPGGSYVDLNTALDTAEFKIEGRRILTDFAAPLRLRYVKQVTDPTQFDAAFVESFAARLAYEIAMPITQSRSVKDDAWSDYVVSIREAVKANAIEVAPEQMNDDAWLQARMG